MRTVHLRSRHIQRTYVEVVRLEDYSSQPITKVEELLGIHIPSQEVLGPSKPTYRSVSPITVPEQVRLDP